MDEKFVLTPEILGPILFRSYWKVISIGTPEAGCFKQIAKLALQKLNEVVIHKAHHNCQNVDGETATHFMYYGCLISKINAVESWNAYGITNRWICSGTLENCRTAVEKIYKPLVRKDTLVAPYNGHVPMPDDMYGWKCTLCGGYSTIKEFVSPCRSSNLESES